MNVLQVRSGWAFSYKDYTVPGTVNGVGGQAPFTFPDGRVIGGNPCATGVEEAMSGSSTILLADGGQVFFNSYTMIQWSTDPTGHQCCEVNTTYYLPSALVDPYGQSTHISYAVAGHDQFNNPVYRLDKITEPGGRYLQILWQAASYPNPGYDLISEVDAYNTSGNLTQWVKYTWAAASNGISYITHVDYSDGTSADYTYTSAGNTNLSTADDSHYSGAMRQIQYNYLQVSGKSTQQIAQENNLRTQEMVTQRSGSPASNGGTLVAEIRGDGATRSFAYDPGAKYKNEICTNQLPSNGKLTSYTDFFGHTTNITYDSSTDSNGNLTAHYGFIQQVTDPNGHTTTYTRQANSWGITKITHPDGRTIQQTFWPSNSDSQPYYLQSRTDERGNTTTYNRDANNRIIEKDYPDGGLEQFTYNSFGEVTTHVRKKDASTNETESFVYDSRGLKTSYTDATGGTTTYSYYTSGPWTDRLQTVTDPMNASGQQASETYEYDRDANGNPIAGRGLVTKIMHADGTFVSNVYNKYGDLLSTTDELGHTTTHTYDDYGRVLTTTTPSRFAGDSQNHTTTNNYVPMGKTSSEITTSKLPFSTTLPSGKQTTFEYDANWRKTAVHVAPGTSDAATTQYVYDAGTSPDDGSANIGRLTSTIDPRGNATTYAYDRRDRQIWVTDPLGTLGDPTTRRSSLMTLMATN